MKVLLNANIEKLGKLGDIIEVKPGYARNFLFPKKLALEPNKHNLEVMEYKKIKAQKQLELEKLSAIEQKKKLEEITLIIKKKAGEQDQLFGSVTAMEIEKKLEEEFNTIIERKKFHLEDHIKKLGSYVCKIRLVEDIVADLKIEVVPEEERPEAPAEEAETENETVETTEPVVAEEKEEEEVVEDTKEETKEDAPVESETETEPEAPAEESEKTEE